MFEVLGVTFHWYGILLGLGVLAAMEAALARGKQLDRRRLESAMWWTISSGVVGARIYHVADLWTRYYAENPIKIIYLWEGGLGIWGAIGGGLIGLLTYCYFNKLKFLKYLDILVIGIPLAQTIGRLGNFVNGELIGKNGEPLFAYEGVLNLILFGILWKISEENNKPGLLAGVYLLGYGIIRALLENLRPEQIIWKVGEMPMAILFSIAAILAGSYLIFRKKRS
jgi:phosphatidylglycerol:prolipoprotein diacylglycerol transferase